MNDFIAGCLFGLVVGLASGILGMIALFAGGAWARRSVSQSETVRRIRVSDGRSPTDLDLLRKISDGSR